MTKTQRTGIIDWLGLAFWLGVSFAAAWVGSHFQPGEWYARLNKPALTPPGWLFGPVWTVLYACMALAAWLVWRKRGLAGAKRELALFAVQLALNVAWSWLFFGLRSPGLAFADIVLLLAAIAATTAAFWRVSTTAGLLFVPYLGWVAFAGVLNFAIWRMNV